jgi:hypothetical protein
MGRSDWFSSAWHYRKAPVTVSAPQNNKTEEPPEKIQGRSNEAETIYVSISFTIPPFLLIMTIVKCIVQTNYKNKHLFCDKIFTYKVCKYMFLCGLTFAPVKKKLY